MKTLGVVPPTPEQLTVIDDPAPGYWLIQGSAGSGKTTTALLRLKFLVRYWRERRISLGLDRPVRVLVLTFNRTLRGYIDELAHLQIEDGPDVDMEVSTFGAWAQQLLKRVVLDQDPKNEQIRHLAGSTFPWSPRFLISEVDYVLGRFLPADLEKYIDLDRKGRGLAPRVGKARRRRLLDDVVYSYRDWKASKGVQDWNDLAVHLAQNKVGDPYDVVVVDESQDFSANQVRAVSSHLAAEFVCTFIRDTTQRIYPNYFSWSEIGLSITAGHNRRLTTNHRNTKQIAAFARPLVEGIEAVEDAALPDFSGCVREGPLPVVLRGRYNRQVKWALGYLRSGQISSDETVAFLHPLGGGWFGTLRNALTKARVPWTSLTREAEWPQGPEQIALSTMHSAKGLEFDHVILLGYNAEVVPHGEEAGDSLLETHRRVLAMAIGRARRSVILGYKPSDASSLIDFLDASTFDAIDLE